MHARSLARAGARVRSFVRSFVRSRECDVTDGFGVARATALNKRTRRDGGVAVEAADNPSRNGRIARSARSFRAWGTYPLGTPVMAVRRPIANARRWLGGPRRSVHRGPRVHTFVRVPDKRPEHGDSFLVCNPKPVTFVESMRVTV